MNVEKYILRQSFSHLEKMPQHVLNRQKEKMSDGIGYGWVNTLMDYCKEKDGNEAKHHGKIFDEYYANRRDIIIERELPQVITDYIARHQGSGLAM